jgi:HEPN domain-containing protein
MFRQRWRLGVREIKANNMAKAEFLKQKAEAFFESACEQIQKKRYFLAAFSFEQAGQLYLKYCLFLKLKDFPKIHEIDGLLKEIGKAYEKKKKVEEFLKENASVIGDLNQAYITARYLPVDFSAYQVEEMREFIKRLVNFLKKLCPKL